jgi:hypothetical protein
MLSAQNIQKINIYIYVAAAAPECSVTIYLNGGGAAGTLGRQRQWLKNFKFF